MSELSQNWIFTYYRSLYRLQLTNIFMAYVRCLQGKANLQVAVGRYHSSKLITWRSNVLTDMIIPGASSEIILYRKYKTSVQSVLASLKWSKRNLQNYSNIFEIHVNDGHILSLKHRIVHGSLPFSKKTIHKISIIQIIQWSLELFLYIEMHKLLEYSPLWDLVTF